MAQIDYDRELTLIAAPAAQPEALIAIATLIADPDRARAEFAVLIHHDYAGRGVGRHLMEQLLAQARRGGIGVVHGEVLRENDGMRGLARALGFHERIDPDDPGCVIVEIATGGSGDIGGDIGGDVGGDDSARIAAQTPLPV
jgi:GNAT superfamily N-acetyltransferase